MNGRHAPSDITVSVDAMGGDNAPEEVVKGAIEACQRGVNVVLVGRQEVVKPLLGDFASKIQVVHADDVIAMDEPVSTGMRHRRSSLQIAAEMVTEEKADAVVSCGNSAAIFFVAISTWGTQEGIDRPAFGGTLPTRDGRDVFVLDIGANTSVKAGNLVQFAIMGQVYVQIAWGISRPRVALLSNGTEDSKGTKVIKEANEALHKLDINFVGNVEGNHLFAGAADVVVCDGFSGNILLKVAEGVATEIFNMVKTEVSKDVVSKLAAGVLRPALRRVVKRVDYEEIGGAPVLGVNGVMINCHGRSKAKAVRNAILLADRMASEGLVDRIGDALHEEHADAAGRRRRLARALHLRHVEA